jgi:hypothetical protein
MGPSNLTQLKMFVCPCKWKLLAWLTVQPWRWKQIHSSKMRKLILAYTASCLRGHYSSCLLLWEPRISWAYIKVV